MIYGVVIILKLMVGFGLEFKKNLITDNKENFCVNYLLKIFYNIKR
jgi:hypothetical protein